MRNKANGQSGVQKEEQGKKGCKPIDRVRFQQGMMNERE
ncbi:Hypothetical protein Minf_0728 [Methylacidiphilum infernorum V4]|uniref:Uncharacterized protein n=1 Tax=Methylacidiphilum infernorum (isolate V4) TaxID=481448 RepID=B3E0M9_METI4|nr:Hypothetical protein Minf_0728 [Methylacidiphilum infernorum V4]